MSRAGRDFRHSFRTAGIPTLDPKEEATYNHGIAAAIVIGLMALVLPALWIALWYLSDMGEAVTGSDHTRPRAV